MRRAFGGTDPDRFLHDARTWGGSSGGPLPDSLGAVMGVHLARTAHPQEEDNRVVPRAAGIRIERADSPLPRHGVRPARAEPRRVDDEALAIEATETVPRLLCLGD